MDIRNSLGLRIAWQTAKDRWKVTLVLTLVFMGMAAMYVGAYPAFEDSLEEMASSMPEMTFIRGFENFTSYAGFLNMELYQVFWILILGILVGFLAASLISKEVEGKTIDLFMANPISRRRAVFEKFLGLVPLIVILNLVTAGVVYGLTMFIKEDLDVVNLLLVHGVSIPYLLAIASLGLFFSVLIDEKMKASVVMIALVIGMYIIESISLIVPDYESIGLVSLIHYYNPADILLHGEVDVIGLLVLVGVTVVGLLLSMVYFEWRDIAVT